MNSKKTRTFTGTSCRKNPLEYSTHAVPALEPLVQPIKGKEMTGHRKLSLTPRRCFPSRSPSGACVALSNFFSMTKTDVQYQCRIMRRCCCCSLTTAKSCRSCGGHFAWWVMLLFRSTATKSANCVHPHGRTYIYICNKYHCF